MLPMATTQINLRLDDDLLAKVDAACGDVPRNRWLVRAVEQALGEGAAGAGQLGDNQMSPERNGFPGQRGTAGTTPGARADSSVVSPAPAERPAEDLMTRLEDSLRNVRSSQQAKAGTGPRLKGGK